MKSAITLYLSLLLTALAFSSATAQCKYTTVKNGSLSDPSIYAGYATGCRTAPTGTDDIIINNAVTLSGDFEVTSGSITITSTGSLSGTSQTLSIDSKTGNGTTPQLTIIPTTPGVRSTPQLVVSMLYLNKTTLNIGNGAIMQVGCIMLLKTRAFINLGNNSLLNVLGNIELETASSAIAGPLKAAGGAPAGVQVYSSVVENRGGIKSIFEYETNLDVKVQNNPLSTNCHSVLPVTLTRFSATRSTDGSSVSLSWATASEVNNAFFMVERSADAITFESLGQLAGAHTSIVAHTYAFVDAHPLANTTYYRLRQVDLDGSDSFSPVVTVAEAHPSADWLVRTSPQHYTVLGSGELHVLDVMGRSLFKQTLSATRNEVLLPDFPAGVYLFQFITEKGRSTIRLAL